MSDFTPLPGMYAVTRTKSKSGILISVGTLSEWDHAFIVAKDGKLIEASWSGVRFAPLSKYPRAAFNRHDNLTAEELANIVAFAESREGERYGFLDIAVIVLRKLGLRAFTDRASAWLDKRKGLICSQLVSLAYKSAGRALTDKLDNLVTPADLAERMLFL
jgi:cell wall-associated NlpC family hydrolase